MTYSRIEKAHIACTEYTHCPIVVIAHIAWLLYVVSVVPQHQQLYFRYRMQFTSANASPSAEQLSLFDKLKPVR